MKRKDVISMIVIIMYCICVITLLRWSVFQINTSNDTATTMYEIHDCCIKQDTLIMLQPPYQYAGLLNHD